MLEAIAIKLVTALTGLLFNMGVKSMDKIQIDNAPSWYMEESNSNYIYVFSFKNGGIETIDPLKADLEIKMEKKIQDIIQTLIYENFRNINDPLEKELVNQFKKDANLPVFVKRYIKINRIKQQKGVKKGLFREQKDEITFGSAILPKKELINYQKERLSLLREKIELGKSKKAYDKLDSEIESSETEEELEGEIPIL